MKKSEPKRRVFPVQLDPGVERKAKAIAKADGISLAEVFRRAVLAYPLEQPEC